MKEIEQKIKDLISEIQPYLNMEGGDIEFIKYEDNYVYVKLIGACANCEAQDNTLKDYVLSMLQSEIPEIVGIINVPL